MKRGVFSLIALFVSCLCLILAFQSYLDSRSRNNIPVELIDSLVTERVNAMNLDQQLNINRETAVTKAIFSASPAIVGIHVVRIREYSKNAFFNDPVFSRFFPNNTYKKKIQSLGSGVIISQDGLIVTNSHVLGENPVDIYITLSGGEKYKAEVIGSDPLTDLALLKIDLENCPFIPLADSDKIMIGESVVALGNPFGLFNYSNKPIATLGIISSLHMDFGETKGGQVYQDMIQTDASINSGNSGGALVNMQGKLIGINTFIFSGSKSGTETGSVGIGFAIPSNRVQFITDELSEKGQVEWDWDLGVSGQALNTSLVDYYRLDVDHGIIITAVEENKTGDKAGIKIGDIIQSINGQDINSIQDIVSTVQSAYLRAGDYINLLVYRNGSQMSVEVELE